MSRRLTSLETRLGVRLAERSTRQLVLTEAGKLYLAQIKPLIAELGAADIEVSALADSEPRGHLRISLPESSGPILTGGCSSAARAERKPSKFKPRLRPTSQNSWSMPASPGWGSFTRRTGMSHANLRLAGLSRCCGNGSLTTLRGLRAHTGDRENGEQDARIFRLARKPSFAAAMVRVKARCGRPAQNHSVAFTQLQRSTRVLIVSESSTSEFHETQIILRLARLVGDACNQIY